MNTLQHRGQSASLATPVYMLHGAFAVPDTHHGYTVIEVQQGVVTALDADTITVVSPDGYVRTYPLGSERTSALPHLGPGSRVTAMLANGELHLTEVGEPPADGARLPALVPVDPLAG